MVAIVLRHGHGVAGRPAARNNAYFVHRVAVGQHARHNGVDNARFAVADAGAFMRDMAAQAAAAGRAGADEEGRPLVLLMDPPRAGSTEEFLRAAVQLAPEVVMSATVVMPLDRDSRPPRMAESYQSATSIFADSSRMVIIQVA